MPLANWQGAAIPVEKFVRYALDPTNRRGREKWRAFAVLGYDLSTVLARRHAAADITGQLRSALGNAEVRREARTAWGQRCRVDVPLVGPNGRAATLTTVWQYDLGSDRPRLITAWARVHEEGRE
jgi:hypothetical protein